MRILISSPPSSNSLNQMSNFPITINDRPPSKSQRQELKREQNPSMDLLVDDVMEKILVRLPTKPLFQFKCVAKRYLDMISKSSFANQYQLNWPSVVFLIFQFGVRKFAPISEKEALIQLSSNRTLIKKDDEISKSVNIELDFLFKRMEKEGQISFLNRCPFPLCVLHSCNGLILCGHPNYFTSRYYVCSPSSRQWIQLPEVSKEVAPYSNAILHFPEGAKHFKVVRFPCVSHGLVQIFSSETGTWSTVHIVDCPDLPPSLAFNGTVYWMQQEVFLSQSVAYHIEDQRISFLQPLPMDDIKGLDCLGQSRGQLYYAKNDSRHITVWAYDDANVVQQWTLKHKVTLKAILQSKLLQDLLFDHQNADLVLEPIGFNPLEENILLLDMFDENAMFFGHRYILSYNMKNGTIQKEYKTLQKTRLVHRWYACNVQYVHPAWPVFIPPVKNISSSSLEI